MLVLKCTGYQIKEKYTLRKPEHPVHGTIKAMRKQVRQDGGENVIVLVEKPYAGKMQKKRIIKTMISTWASSLAYIQVCPGKKLDLLKS